MAPTWPPIRLPTSSQTFALTSKRLPLAKDKANLEIIDEDLFHSVLLANAASDGRRAELELSEVVHAGSQNGVQREDRGLPYLQIIPIYFKTKLFVSRDSGPCSEPDQHHGHVAWELLFPRSASPPASSPGALRNLLPAPAETAKTLRSIHGGHLYRLQLRQVQSLLDPEKKKVLVFLSITFFI